LIYEPGTISAVIFQEGIMDLIRESSLFQSLTQQSREEGIEEGIEQGERRSTTEAIFEVLEIRFDLNEAHPLSTRITAIDDLQYLKQLHRAAIQVPNLEAFQRVLDA
jgi:hypothetical protein